MMDLIIPVYKNKPGLYRTLMSIGTEVSDKIKVTIVDDCSNESYEDIIELFQKIFPIRILSLNKNSGPGIARQFGLNNAKEEYISFVDCGDTFVTPTIIKESINIIKEYPEINMFSWQQLEEKPDGSALVVPAGHNRLHGKIYKTSFIKNHNISFSEICPRANEDIGFNYACRWINQQIYQIDNINHILEIEEPMIVWKHEGPSIVRSNNYAYYFKDQNLGLALNAEHALQIALKNNVENSIISKTLYEIMACMYTFYLSTKSQRPEFTDEALSGALYFYKNIFLEYADINPEKMKNAFYEVLLSFLNDPGDPMRQTLLVFDYAGFLNYLQELLEKEQSIEEG